MRSLRTLSALALAALLALVGTSAAAAKKPPKVAAFAAKYRLTGAWKHKDADRDGLTNLKEFKLGTNPKAADTDRDGLKDGDEVASGNDPRDRDTDGDGIRDGAEHAGVVTAFDGETVTIREFVTRKPVTATVDTGCAPADDDSYDDSLFADEFEDDELDGDDECDDVEELEVGLVLSGAEFERDGGTLYLVAYDVA